MNEWMKGKRSEKLKEESEMQVSSCAEAKNMGRSEARYRYATRELQDAQTFGKAKDHSPQRATLG
jgi:hypothetical protein